MNFRNKVALWLWRRGFRWLAWKLFDVKNGKREFIELTKVIMGRMMQDD